MDRGFEVELRSWGVFPPLSTPNTAHRSPEEAVQLANHTPYGLSASVWAESVGVALGAFFFA